MEVVVEEGAMVKGMDMVVALVLVWGWEEPAEEGVVVEATEVDVEGPRVRSWGHVMVADCRRMGWSRPSTSGTEATSTPWRYFSIRRMETRDWSMLMSVSGSALSANLSSSKTVKIMLRLWVWSGDQCTYC